MDLGDHLVDLPVVSVGNERFVSVRRKQKGKKTVLHPEQGIGLRRRVELEIRGLVISDIGAQFGRRRPFDHLTTAENVLQVDIFPMRLPLEGATVPRILPQSFGEKLVSGKVHSGARLNIPAIL